MGSTLTTVVVFLPLGFLKGALGEFFVALSVTLTMRYCFRCCTP